MLSSVKIQDPLKKTYNGGVWVVFQSDKNDLNIFFFRMKFDVKNTAVLHDEGLQVLNH